MRGPLKTFLGSAQKQCLNTKCLTPPHQHTTSTAEHVYVVLEDFKSLEPVNRKLHLSAASPIMGNSCTVWSFMHSRVKHRRAAMSKQAVTATAGNPLFKSDAFHLLFCVVGVVGSLLVYGVLQVRPHGLYVGQWFLPSNQGNAVLQRLY